MFWEESFLYKSQNQITPPHDSEFPELFIYVGVKTLNFDLLLVEYFNSLN